MNFESPRAMAYRTLLEDSLEHILEQAGLFTRADI